MNRLDYALQLAAAGFFIHPLLPNSKSPPLGSSWVKERTTDPVVIRLWFEHEPTMNYGVSGGDNRVIIDADLDPAKGKDGEAEIQKLEAEHVEAPITWATFTVQSPRGGKHYYFKGVDHVGNAHSFPKGIDVRGANGYVVGPGCHTEDDGKSTVTGDYIVEYDVPVADVPEWTLGFFARAAQKTAETEKSLGELDTQSAIDRARVWLRTREPAIEGSGGDAHTYATAALMKDYGISDLKCMELLVETPPGGRSWNDRCQPPWEIEELTFKVTNAYRYGTNRPGTKGDALMEDAIDLLGLPDSIMPSEETIMAVTEDDPAKPDAKGKVGLEKLAFYGTELAARDVDLEMVIPQWLPAHGLTAFLAERGTGKTVIMLDQSLRMACDMTWHKVKCSPNWVSIYLCGEGDVEAQLHFQAWLKHHSSLGVNEPSKERFVFMTGIPDLLNVEDVKAWTQFMKNYVGDRRAIIYLDTWQRASSRASQNDDVLMQTAFHNAEAIARSLKGPIVAAFHPPKHSKDTISGAYALENNTTTIQTMVKEANDRVLTISRAKGTGEGRYGRFAFDIIETGGKDQFDKALTGIVPRLIGGQLTEDPEHNNTDAALADTVNRQMYAEIIAQTIAAVEQSSSIRVDAIAGFLAKAQAGSSAFEALAEAKEHTSDVKAILLRLERLFVGSSVTKITSMPGCTLHLKGSSNFPSQKFSIEHDRG